MITRLTGGSKLPSIGASKKAEEAVKSGRLVVTGQLLQMLSNSQRPRSAAPSGVDSKRKGPLAWKFHDISTKLCTGSGTSNAKRQPPANVSKLHTEVAGASVLDVKVANVEPDCASEDKTAGLATADADNTFTTNSSPDNFCPKITNIISLDQL